jgi:hypothetical protein
MTREWLIALLITLVLFGGLISLARYTDFLPEIQAEERVR